MDELAVRCQQQLATFRIKELKDVLARIGVAKQGKKQVLVDKIMALVVISGSKLEKLSNKYSVSRKEVVKVIDDIYRKTHGSGAGDLASKGMKVTDGSNSLVHADDQDEFANRGEGKTRCPCGSSIDMGTMIQCDELKCGVWQHIDCVIFSEKEGVQPEVPSQFYCEICRIQRGDPFSVAVAHPMLPTKLTTSLLSSEGSNPLQNMEKSFILSRADQELLHKPNHDIQVWCILLNDKVPFRMQWPAYSDLHVNGVSVRVTNRPGQQLLGANGRDDGPGIGACTREGTNRISFSAYDARPFCIGIRIIHRLTVQQVLRFVPSQSEGEPFEDALARVRRCISGGNLGNNDDSDSDLEVVADSVTVNLRCPMNGSRIRIAGRFKPCLHMGCFDLDTFVELNQRTRKWQCPICLKNYSLEDLIIDPFFNCIAIALKSYGEDVTEVEMKPDGFWRPKLEGDSKLHEPWHSPDGSIGSVHGGPSSVWQKPLKSVKIENGISVEKLPLKIGIKRTRDGWQVNGTGGHPSFAGNSSPVRDPIPKRKAYSQSSSVSGSKDENCSVNQDRSRQHRYSAWDNVEVASRLMELPSNWLVSGLVNGEPEALKNSEVIVLSDTEEENVDNLDKGLFDALGYDGAEDVAQTSLAKLLSPGLVSEEVQGGHDRVEVVPGDGDHLQRPAKGFGSCMEVDSLPQTTAPPLDFLGGAPPIDKNNFWSSELQNTPFEFFTSGSDTYAATCNHHSPVRPAPVPAIIRPRFGLSVDQQRQHNISDRGFLECSGPLGTSSDFFTSESNGEALEGTMGLASKDSSLRFLLPPQPARAPVQATLCEPAIASGERIGDDWISLSLGSRESVPNTLSPNVVPPYIDQQLQGRERLDSLANTASVLLGMSSDGIQIPARNTLTNMQASPEASGHRFARRSRHYFQVHSDSE